MSLFVRDALGRLIPVNPGLPVARGNQGGMGRRLDEAGLMATLPDADLAGATGPGVVPGGEQTVGARRAKLEAAEIIPPAPTFRPLGGATQNNRGNVRLVTLGTLAGSPIQNIPSVVETSKNSGDDAEVLTVQLGLEIPEQLSDPASNYATTLIDVTAVIEWGVGGAFFSAECDWNQGTSFSVCASFIRVSARVAAVAATGDPDLTMVLRASLAYGNSNSLNVSSPTRKTVNIADSMVTLATSPLIAIPVWALGFTIVDGGNGPFANAPQSNPPDYTIRLYETSSLVTAIPRAVYKFTSRTNLGSNVEGQFPIPARCRFFDVTNNLGVTSRYPKLIFNLGF